MLHALHACFCAQHPASSVKAVIGLVQAGAPGVPMTLGWLALSWVSAVLSLSGLAALQQLVSDGSRLDCFGCPACGPPACSLTSSLASMHCLEAPTPGRI